MHEPCVYLSENTTTTMPVKPLACLDTYVHSSSLSSDIAARLPHGHL